MSQRRLEKVAALLQREVAGFIERKVKNPAVGFITVTGVKLSTDMKYAKIYVVCRGDAEQKERSLGILKGCVPSIRRSLNEVLRLRYIPMLIFVPDTTYDLADRIDDLLDDIHEEENL